MKKWKEGVKSWTSPTPTPTHQQFSLAPDLPVYASQTTSQPSLTLDLPVYTSQITSQPSLTPNLPVYASQTTSQQTHNVHVDNTYNVYENMCTCMMHVAHVQTVRIYDTHALLLNKLTHSWGMSPSPHLLLPLFPSPVFPVSLTTSAAPPHDPK